MPGTDRSEPVTLLLIEDEDIVRGPLVRILADAGYEVLEATSGGAALAIVAGRPTPPALVIADVHLHGMSGIDLLHRLRAEGVGAPVLLMSGLAQPDDELLPSETAGPVRFLMKGQLLQGRPGMALLQFVLAAVLWLAFLGWIIHIWSILDAARWDPTPDDD
jgi:CheY-like chemotaxis protein